MCLVTICIPTYNRKEFIKEAIDSCLSQTFKDFEIIIGDDGSTDDTQPFVEALGYPLEYHYFEHAGQEITRNRLIKLAKGKFLTFLDSDDVLCPDFLASAMDVVAQKGENIVVYGRYVGLDEHGNEIPKGNHSLPEGDILADLFSFIYVHSCGTLCKTEMFKDAGCFDESLKRCAFYKLLLKLAAKYPFYPVGNITYKKRRHSQNRSDRTYANCLTEYQVLEDFYSTVDQAKKIPSDIVNRRLSQEAYRAGKCAFKEKRFYQAGQMIRKSLSYKSSFKAWGLLGLLQFFK
jgi:glycosyltransferase involved in cell wall biosynthesis